MLTEGATRVQYVGLPQIFPSFHRSAASFKRLLCYYVAAYSFGG